MKGVSQKIVMVGLLGCLIVTASPVQAATLSQAEIRERLQLVRTELLALKDRIQALATEQARSWETELSSTPAPVTTSELTNETTFEAASQLSPGEDVTLQVEGDEVLVPWEAASTTKEAKQVVDELEERFTLLRIKLSQGNLPTGARELREQLKEGWTELQPQMKAVIETENLDEFNRLWQEARVVDAVIETGLDQVRTLDLE